MNKSLSRSISYHVRVGGQACVHSLLKQTEIPTGQVVKVTVSILFDAVCDVCMSGGLYALMRSFKQLDRLV
jgi:hypothetical protein